MTLPTGPSRRRGRPTAAPARRPNWIPHIVVIIIPRITNATTRADLRDFVETVLARWFRLPFSAHPRIVSYRILPVTDRNAITERHGLVNITPDDAALRVIRKLNGTPLNGKRVAVKRYDLTAKQAIFRQG